MSNIVLQHIPSVVITILLIISEVLSLIPEKYIKSNGIIQLIYNIFEVVIIKIFKLKTINNTNVVENEKKITA